MATRIRVHLRASRSIWFAWSAALLITSLLLRIVVATGDGTRAIRSTSGALIRITTASDPDRTSASPSLSADGTIIAFDSDSDFSGQGIAFGQFEIWLYDTTSAMLTRVTTATDATRDSSLPSLSADGTRIAFVGDSDLLNQGILAGQTAVWLYDTQTQAYSRLAVVLDSVPEHLRWVGPPDISADGTRVVFHSNSSSFGQDVPEYQSEIWLYDTTTMTLTRITTASELMRYSVYPKLSADGTKIVFYSDSDFLGQGIPYGQFEIWLYDTITMTYTRITTSTGGDSTAPSISADGTRIVFNSDMDFAAQTQDHFEVWLYDQSAMAYTRVTTSDFPRDSWSFFPELDPSGRKVAFVSDSDFLDEGAVEGQNKLWLYDTATMTYTRVPDTGHNEFLTYPASMSADGAVLAFSDGVDIWLYQTLDLTPRIYLPIVSKHTP